MSTTVKKVVLSLAAAVLVGGGAFYFTQRTDKNGVSGTETIIEANDKQELEDNKPAGSEVAVTVPEPEKPSIIENIINKVDRETKIINDTYIAKPTVLIDVPFSTQAPYGNWDSLHEEACEEASMIMADSYVHSSSLNESIMEQKIQDQITWQSKNGYGVDVTVPQVKVILKNYYKVENTAVIESPSVDAIKKALAEDKVIIMPAAGRLLGNPYFSGLGPIYHMLVIVGYDDDTQEFVTNDPGTRRGEKFRYKYSVIMNAIHDWNGEKEITAGAKRVLTVGK